MKHWKAVQRIVGYLQSTLNYQLILSPTTDSINKDKFTLTGFVDADWSGDIDTHKSTTGYAFYLNSSLITWGSKGQSTVSTSSAHAESIALYHATCEMLWIRKFLISFGLYEETTLTPIFCDNEAVINLTKFNMITPRTKHFDTKMSFVREQVEDLKLSVKQVSGTENIADIFTKALGKLKFCIFRDKLGITAARKC